MYDPQLAARAWKAIEVAVQAADAAATAFDEAQARFDQWKGSQADMDAAWTKVISANQGIVDSVRIGWAYLHQYFDGLHP